ncbi:GGDEF domain-containing protein [Butyrivibrio sp. JL13D10]|uniref:GGDEF domain-containing protein n=1 Tax=Butyrivibrio sp. JL13D10 TaxID=3236815 RepID=UPI0038B52603
MSKENDDPKLIVGLINIDNQVRKEEAYTEALADAENLAATDALTGIKNKHAYSAAEAALKKQLDAGTVTEYAIVMFDLNNLKYVNDTFGHKTGDEYIKNGCKIICETFAHSPVFRIGGDEFVAITQGDDYRKIDYLVNVLDAKNHENRVKGAVTIAVGYARGDRHSSVSSVFEQADKNMYKHKQKFMHR